MTSSFVKPALPERYLLKQNLNLEPKISHDEICQLEDILS